MRLSKIIILLIIVTFTINAATKIKFATVATEGSTWMKVMHELAKAVEDSTNGEVKFKIYPGAVQGDDDVRANAAPRDPGRVLEIGIHHFKGIKSRTM